MTKIPVWKTALILVWMIFIYALYFFMMKDSPQVQRLRHGVSQALGRSIEKAGG